jgi:glutathione synthase/RimK-type ligase-like ATP-grasp enzyme
MSRVAVVWRGDEEARREGVSSNERLRPVFEALEAVGIDAHPVIHWDEVADETREVLLGVDGVLAWVDPIGRGEDRVVIDAILREAAEAGIWVSAHPDVISTIGTKEVLHRTRWLGWGTDTHRYRTLEELRAGLAARLPAGPRVLKPRYANGGAGVWRVTQHPYIDSQVLVQGAAVRDTTVEVIPFTELIERCAPAFAEGDCFIDQEFQPRVAEGLVRCYLVADRVVGFARQYTDTLLTEPGAADRVFGIPSPKTMFPPDAPEFARLRRLVEDDWVPTMRVRLGLGVDDLPVLWDCDFLFGPPTSAGEDTYLLCEINASCITPFPPEAPAALATVVHNRLTARRGATVGSA